MKYLCHALAGVTLFAVAAPANAQALFFQSPTGNIHCEIDMHGARCDMLELTRSFRDRGNCVLDYGSTFYVESGGSSGPGCVGDTIINPRNPVLNYGESIEVSGVACTSRTSGMTCTNRAGRGFTIRRARQQVF